MTCEDYRGEFYIRDDFEILIERRTLNAEQAERILRQQFSFFEDPGGGRLDLNAPLTPGARIACPRCGTRGRLTERSAGRKVRILPEEGRLTVSCEIGDVFGALALEWVRLAPQDFVLGRPPYYENIEFDLEAGTTTVLITDGGGAAFSKRLTSEAELSGNDPIARAFGNFVLKRRIRAAFSAVYGRPVCFTNDELDLDRYILLTGFIGYGRDFYDGIPFLTDRRLVSRGERRLPESIRGIAKRMHRAEDVPALYESESLPSAKTVRRIVFGSPQLMFFSKELRLLCEVFPDINYFRRLISSYSVYRILSSLVRYGSAKEYLILLRDTFGMRRLFEIMKDGDCTDVLNKGLTYCVMSEEDRMLVRAELTDSAYPMRDIGTLPAGLPCSVPMSHMRKERFDWSFDGFSFRTLRTSGDYDRAGMELKNCLSGYYGSENIISGSMLLQCLLYVLRSSR